MNDPLLKSKSKKVSYFFKWFSVLFFLSLGILCAVGMFKQGDWTVIGIFIVLFLLALAGLQVYMIDPINKIDIYQDRMEVRSMFGQNKRTIYKNEIIFWTEVDKTITGEQIFELVIYAGEEKYKIASSCYKNYHDLKIELTKGKKRNEEFEQAFYKKRGKQFGIGLLIMGGGTLSGFFYRYTHHVTSEVSKEQFALWILAVMTIFSIGLGLFLLRKRED